jgi:hypothetical protein
MMMIRTTKLVTDQFFRAKINTVELQGMATQRCVFIVSI